MDAHFTKVLVSLGQANLTDVVLKTIDHHKEKKVVVRHIPGHLKMIDASGFISSYKHKPFVHMYVKLVDQKNRLVYQGYLLHALVSTAILNLFDERFFEDNPFFHKIGRGNLY